MTFVEDFMEWSKNATSPPIFRKWAALSTLAGAMEQRFYMRTGTGIVYPNMFMLLISPPGIGKSEAISRVHKLWASTGKLRVAPRSITRAGLEDRLVDAQQTDGSVGYIYHSLQIAAPEFGTLLKAHDLDFLNTLNELYDCNEVYDAQTRGKGVTQIDHPQINLIAGTQPKYLAEVMPSAAFGMGFTSRLIMIFSADKVKVNIFPGQEEKPAVTEQQLVNYLKNIAASSSKKGEFLWREDAQKAIQAWYDEGMEPAPDHQKLQNYLGRRLINTIKLSMIYSIAESLEPIVEKWHFEKAREALLEVEFYMPEIFQDMQVTEHQDIISESWTYVRKEYQRNGKKPVRERKLYSFLQQRVPSYQIRSIIDSMIKSGWLQVKGANQTEGMRQFIPTISQE